VYLDTTVPSAYFDDRAEYRRQLTVQFWTDRLPDFEPVISPLVLGEIQNTPNAARRAQLQTLVAGLDVLPAITQADTLSQEYIGRGVFLAKYALDGQHVAVAVVHGVRYFVSWNFRHLVKVKTRREINLVNSITGYGEIEIVAPPEL
jgi:hypothetical protein